MPDIRRPIADIHRIRDDLRGVLRGEILIDDLSRDLYSTDASLLEVRPLGVVCPVDEDDVCTLVRYACEHAVPLIGRGAGTGIAGEALGEGLIVDLSRHFRRIVAIGEDTIRVQPGVVLRELATVLAASGRRFAPDPVNAECTLGGMLANNASGRRVARHGYTREHVESLRVVLDTGEAVEVARHPRHAAPPISTVVAHRSARLYDIVSSLATLLQENAALVQQHRPRTPFNRCGYLLHDVLVDDQVDLRRVLVGSEGTLGLFTEATLRTIPLPAGQGAVLLSFDRLDDALEAAQYTLDTQPVVCDLLDRRLLSLARTRVPIPLPTATEAVLLVEYEANSPAEARDACLALAERLQWQHQLAVRALVANDDEERENLCRVRDATLPALQALRGGARSVSFLEDIAVPRAELTGFLDGLQKLLQQHETTASFLVHTTTGQINIRPLLDLRRHEDMVRLHALTERVYSLTLEMGGTISSRYGVGLIRTPWVERQSGPLYPILRQVKAIFDPRHLLNPGKIIARAEQTLAWQFRTGLASSLPVANEEPPAELLPHPTLGLTATGLPTALRWSEDDPLAESRMCNGCGECRTSAPNRRMCPIFRAEPEEASTPRAKANLVRHLLHTGDLRTLASSEVRALADLCVNCKMCAHECPAEVNIPKLMLETKAAYVGQHELDRDDWVLARAETFARLGSLLAPASNLLLHNRYFRWFLEKIFGLSRQRRLPAFARTSFLRQAAKRGWTRPPAPRAGERLRVALFVDVFANYHDPLIAEAAVAVLHHNGIEVYVPPGQRGCGMAPLACGDATSARATVVRNLRVLVELAREGYTIVCTEPTAAVMFQQDTLDLLADAEELADAQLVAQHTVEWTTFVWDLLQEGRIRTDFQPLGITIGHHVPCHIKALGNPPRGPMLLSLIPGMRVRTIDVSCSGMAGTYGLKAVNYAASLAAGRPMLEELARVGVLFGSTECSTCRLQMEDHTEKRTLHPAQYLALAYGLLPELIERLHQPIHERCIEYLHESPRATLRHQNVRSRP